jgi:hypothetical protein
VSGTSHSPAYGIGGPSGVKVDIHGILAAFTEVDRTAKRRLTQVMKRTAETFTANVRRMIPMTGRGPEHWKTSIAPIYKTRSGSAANYKAGVYWRTVPWAGPREFGGTLANRYTHGQPHPDRHQYVPKRPDGYFVYPERKRELPEMTDLVNDAVRIALQEAGFDTSKFSS